MSFFTDNVIAALIAGAVTIAVGLGGWFSGRALKREGVAERGLSAQLEGWKNFALSLREHIDELEERIAACERDRIALWRKLKDLDLRGE